MNKLIVGRRQIKAFERRKKKTERMRAIRNREEFESKGERATVEQRTLPGRFRLSSAAQPPESTALSLSLYYSLSLSLSLSLYYSLSLFFFRDLNLI
jgi:hypothetical protein